MDYIFITKFVNRKEYDEHCSVCSSYTPIRQVKGGWIVGFLIAGEEIPDYCQLPTKDELKLIKRHREGNNHYPIPSI